MNSDMIISSENIIGERLRLLRSVYFNQTQKEFSSFLGITHQALSAYELGKAKPSLDVLINISKVTEVSMDWLCGTNQKIPLQNLGDIFELFVNLFSVREFSIKTEIHDRVDIEGSNRNDDSTRNWIKLMFYHCENHYNHELIYSQSICNVIRKALEVSELRKNNRYPSDYFDKEKEYWINYYSKCPITLK